MLGTVPGVLTSEVGGENRSAAEAPTGNPSPAPKHPHRTHDTTDQWRDIRCVARPNPDFGLLPVVVSLALASTAFCHTYKLILTILEDMDLASNQNVNKT